MTNIKSIMLRRYQRQWAWILAGVIVAAAAGMTGIVLVDQGVIDADPWRYLGLAVAAWASVVGMVITMARAVLEEGTTSAHNRHQAELRMKSKQERRSVRA